MAAATTRQFKHGPLQLIKSKTTGSGNSRRFLLPSVCLYPARATHGPAVVDSGGMVPVSRAETFEQLDAKPKLLVLRSQGGDLDCELPRSGIASL